MRKAAFRLWLLLPRLPIEALFAAARSVCSSRRSRWRRRALIRAFCPTRATPTIMLKGVKLVRRIVQAPALAKYRDKDLFAGRASPLTRR